MRKHLKALFLALTLLGLPGLAWGAMAVIDQTAIGKLVEQLNKLQQQIEELMSISKTLQEQINAVGRMGQITLPSINLGKLGSKIRREVQCMKPDFSKLFPGLKFEDVDFDSVCEGAPAYRQALWVDPDDLRKLPDWRDRAARREEVEKRRERVLVDSATKGIALADVMAKETENQNKAADELATSAAAAQTQNDRLAVIAQGQVLNARIQAQTNQILAQLLHVQSVTALAMGVPAESLKNPEGAKK